MPHHESGMLALKTCEPKIIDRAVAFLLKEEPNHSVEMVRVAGGDGVMLTFGSVLSNESGEHVDMSAFQSVANFRKLAKLLKKPLWGGHAYGGYTNSQTAVSVGADGGVKWKSSFDFGVPKKMRAAYGDPFTDADERHRMNVRARAENGYGRIGAELGFDYFRIIDIEVGDALLARDKRLLGEGGAAEHAKWLKGNFVAPEGKDSDASTPHESTKEVLIRCLTDRADVAVTAAAVLSRLLDHRKLKSSALAVAVGIQKNETVLRLGGTAVPDLTGTLCSEEFLKLLPHFLRGSTFVYRVIEDSPHMAAGQGYGSDISMYMKASRQPLHLVGIKFDPVPLTATAAQVKEIDAARRQAAQSLDEEADF